MSGASTPSTPNRSPPRAPTSGPAHGAPLAAACRRRSDCRLCGSVQVAPVLRLEPTPPANAFVPAAARGREQPCFPLDLHLCEGCGHVQLLDVVDPRTLFEHYVYVSGTSPVFVRHFRDYAEWVIGGFSPEDRALVVDVGSNDGTLLRFFADRGYRVLGVDPAVEIARAATNSGIPTLPEFFTPDLARAIRDDHGHAAVVTANNVIAHTDDMAGFTEGVRSLLAPDGIFVFEVSYLADVLEKTLFDTIYHEHLAYHSVKPLARFLGESGLELIDVLGTEPHGGSLRGVAQLAGGKRPVAPSVAAAVAREEALGLGRPETYQAFARRIDGLRDRLGALVRDLVGEGRRLAGFGAPAKATTLMYHFGIGADVIDFIVDDSPLKQGLFSPGLHIPVLPAGALYSERPDVAIVLAWNFARPIMEKHHRFVAAGGRFVVPLPELEVYPE